MPSILRIQSVVQNCVPSLLLPASAVLAIPNGSAVLLPSAPVGLCWSCTLLPATCPSLVRVVVVICDPSLLSSRSSSPLWNAAASWAAVVEPLGFAKRTELVVLTQLAPLSLGGDGGTLGLDSMTFSVSKYVAP